MKVLLCCLHFCNWQSEVVPVFVCIEYVTVSQYFPSLYGVFVVSIVIVTAAAFLTHIFSLLPFAL